MFLGCPTLDPIPDPIRSYHHLYLTKLIRTRPRESKLPPGPEWVPGIHPMMSVCALLAIMQESTPDHAIHGSGARISYNRDTLDEALTVELITANGAPDRYLTT